MKKAFLWIGIVLLSPIILFIILTTLLYVPPIQNWAVDIAAEKASEATGMEILVDEVDLDFPLDLGINGVTVIRPQHDTIAQIGRIVVDVQLLPLVKSNVIVNELLLAQAKINTHDLIPDLQVQGNIGSLSTRSHGISLEDGIAELNNTRLEDADLTLLLNDTAAVDTTTSEPVAWLIKADSLTVLRSRIEVHMPGDSMIVSAQMGRAGVQEANINLLNGVYTVQSFELSDGAVTYDLPFEQRIERGLDYNHIALSNTHLAIDSIYFAAPTLALKIRETRLQEQSGLAVTHLAGDVLMDSLRLQLSNLLLSTPYSNIRARVDYPFSLLDPKDPGQLHAWMDASLGKQDLQLFMADLPQSISDRWPEWPLTLQAQADGNMKKMEIGQFEMSLPTAFHASARGTAGNLTDTNHLLAQLQLQAETYDLGFATTLLDKDLRQHFRIPYGIRMIGNVSADGPRYTANLTASEGKGSVFIKGFFNQAAESYDALLRIKDMNLHHFLPKDSLYEISAHATASGHGFDFFKPTCRLDADATIEHLHYGHLTADSIKAKATLTNGHALAELSGQNGLIDGHVKTDALLGTNNLQATISADVRRLDLYSMQLVPDPLTVGMCGHIDIESNLSDRHRITGLLGELYISDTLNTYRPDDIGITLRANPDTTYLRMQSGNFILKADASGSYDRLFTQLGSLADSCMAQLHNRVIDHQQIKRLLPITRLYINSGNDNPFADFLQSSANIKFKTMRIDLTTSPQSGINGHSYIYALNADSTRIDTIDVNFKDTDHGLSYQCVVANNRRNPQFQFRALIDGSIREHGAVAGLRFYDDRGQMGLRLGVKADMVDEGINLHLLPERPTIGYKVFTLNKDNFITLRKDFRVNAKVDLIADDGTGVKIYSESQDSTLMQDLTVSLYRFDLDKLTSAIPYVPRIAGVLDGDYHVIADKQGQISIASDMQIAGLVYEQSPVGNLATEFVYLQREDDTHAVEGRLMLEGQEIGMINGEYKNEGNGYLNAEMELTRLPMMIINGFVPDQIIGLEGFAEGRLKVEGELSKPKVDGQLQLDQAYLISKPYGMRLRFENKPVRIVNSRLMFDNYTMYGYNDNPLTIAGYIDFRNTDRIAMDMGINARNYQLINAKQSRESIAYGKAFVNFYSTIRGRLEQLHVRGQLDVLGTTDVTYLLLDSPLSTDNQMDELVKFTDFTDSTQTVVQKPTPQGMDVDINISIDPGVHVLCGLNADLSNYVNLYGGGDLRMKMSNDGMTMTGRYTLSGGNMKYSLPVIPLKTFNIQDGSYVEFRGEMMNPTLNLTATERTKASVSQGEQQGTRNVLFDCGVVITKTLADMGLEFIIDAPEDMTISSELQAMSKEQRGKLAVTMLTTGMYLADGNTQGFTMNSALSSFLQSEINNITGSALKTLDLSVGLDQTTDATGQKRTDYSFNFAKRFWNNRLNVQIGGKVSSGNEEQVQSGQNQSFFDNVTMEYRLFPNSNQYVKLFYNQNAYDWLEGYTGEYGVGYIYKRKMNSIWDIFKIVTDNIKMPTFFHTAPADTTHTSPADTLHKASADTIQSHTHEKK